MGVRKSLCPYLLPEHLPPRLALPGGYWAHFGTTHEVHRPIPMVNPGKSHHAHQRLRKGLVCHTITTKHTHTHTHTHTTHTYAEAPRYQAHRNIYIHTHHIPIHILFAHTQKHITHIHTYHTHTTHSKHTYTTYHIHHKEIHIHTPHTQKQTYTHTMHILHTHTQKPHTPYIHTTSHQIRSDQSLSRVRLFATP